MSKKDIISEDIASTIYNRIDKEIAEVEGKDLSDKEIRIFTKTIERQYEYLRKFNQGHLPLSHERFLMLQEKIEKIKTQK